jgi:hypothetical protein
MVVAGGLAPSDNRPQRDFAIRILTTGGGGGSLALSALWANVMAARFLTAAADISGSLGIGASQDGAFLCAKNTYRRWQGGSVTNKTANRKHRATLPT